MRKDEIIDIIDAVRGTVANLRDMGCRGFDCAAASLESIEEWSRPIRRTHESLDAIRRDLGDCRRCPLCENRKNIVFGAGSPKADLVFVGEGPGYDEDLQGEPFVGAAGRLLTKIIQAMSLTRDRVYICNIVKCRPPKNRNPLPGEIAACLPFLKRQIDAIGPAFICALGTVAARTLLNTNAPISRLRGRFHLYNGHIPVMPTYHPAYLLRNPGKKRDVWEDVQQLMKGLGGHSA